MDALPFPDVPMDMLEDEGGTMIRPCPEVRDWAWSMFLDPASRFYNPDHEHLEEAVIGFLWTNTHNFSKGARILGTAQLGEPAGGNAWAKVRQYEQLERWFDGIIPAYLITLDAVWLSTANAASRCALVEHELYHCAIKKDEFGNVKLDPYGDTIPAMRPHDVECFLGEARRYGAWSHQLRELKTVLDMPPEFGEVELAGVCGTCYGR